MTVQILTGDCREVLTTLADESVNCVVTSPPYFGLRDYGVDGQMGLESSPEEFVAGMVTVFREVRRVLRHDGTLWLNLGDSYAGSGRGGHVGNNSSTVHSVQPNHSRQARATIKSQRRDDASVPRSARKQPGFKIKDLIGIPWRVAFALQADGWYLRQDIIWSKPNPMPESVTDRCTKAHEYLFLLTKAPRYYFDSKAIAEPAGSDPISWQPSSGWDMSVGEGGHGTIHRAPRQKGNRRTFRGGGVYTQGRSHDNDAQPCNDSIGNGPNESGTRNRRSVWTVATAPFTEAHFATFPPELIRPCIRAGSPQGGGSPRPVRRRRYDRPSGRPGTARRAAYRTESQLRGYGGTAHSRRCTAAGSGALVTYILELPLRIESVANGREHWAQKAGRTKRHRQAALALVKSKLPGLPCQVKLTRIAPRRLDGDNCQSGFKALRDGIADRLGVDDGDSRVTWVYAQERGQPNQYACRIEITKLEAACG